MSPKKKRKVANCGGYNTRKEKYMYKEDVEIWNKKHTERGENFLKEFRELTNKHKVLFWADNNQIIYTLVYEDPYNKDSLVEICPSLVEKYF